MIYYTMAVDMFNRMADIILIRNYIQLYIGLI